MVRTFQIDENTINDKSEDGYKITDKIADCLRVVDSCIEEAYEEINRHEDLRYVEYNSLSSDIMKISDYSRDYKNFRKFTSEYVDNVDSPFFKYQEEATKYLSSIRLEDIQIDNNLGITEKYTHPYRTDMPVQDIQKAKLNLEDLLSYDEVDDSLRLEYKEQQEMIKKLKELAALEEKDWPEGITKEQMEKIKAYVSSLKESGEDQESYDDQIKKLLTSGEFDFETKNEKILTTVLDCIPIVGDIKGIDEVMAGKDLVTGRKLSDLEKGVNLVASIVGLTQIGKLASIPAKVAVKESVKAGVKEVLKDGAKYTLKETTKNLLTVEAFNELSKIGIDLGIGPKTQLGIMAGILYGHGKIKGKLAGKTAGNILEDASNADEIKSIAKDSTDLKNIDDKIKATADDTSISKVSDDVVQAVKDEKINKDVTEEVAATSKSGIIENVAKDAADVKNVQDDIKAVVSGNEISKVSKDAEQTIKDEKINNEIDVQDKESVSEAEDLDNILKVSRENSYVKEIESKTSIENIRNSEATSFEENFSKALDDEGLTIDEYISATHKSMKDLSEDMIRKIDRINQSVEMPNSDTLMSKVIPENAYKNCINNGEFSDTVGNCITRAQDMQDCYSYDDYYKKLGLNYINGDGTVSVYTNPDTQALYIERFTSNNTEDYVVHSYGGTTDEDVKIAQNVLGLDDSNTFKMDSPYLGTGVTKDIDSGIGKVEFMTKKGKYCEVSDGAAIYKLERGSGKETLAAVRIDGKWYEVID